LRRCTHPVAEIKVAEFRWTDQLLEDRRGRAHRRTKTEGVSTRGTDHLLDHQRRKEHDADDPG
jgi:hypothetical protein